MAGEVTPPPPPRHYPAPIHPVGRKEPADSHRGWETVGERANEQSDWRMSGRFVTHCWNDCLRAADTTSSTPVRWPRCGRDSRPLCTSPASRWHKVKSWGGSGSAIKKQKTFCEMKRAQSKEYLIRRSCLCVLTVSVLEVFQSLHR